MCGFIGAIGTTLPIEKITTAFATILHRGPDSCDAIDIGSLRLAACRLAIVPPYAASPIFRSSSTILTLNGEIYDLPGKLPSTDTSRLDALLSIEGVAALRNLCGMFAFCRLANGNLLLARDRFGIKPLYWARYCGGVVFASEIKALLALGISREPDQDVLSAIEVIGFNVFPGRTPFAKVAAIKPGFAYTFSEDGIAIGEYQFAKTIDSYTPKESYENTSISEQVEIILDKSVRRAMLHDPQPKGIFFSGGLDSSLILDLARTQGPVTAFVLSDCNDSDDIIEARKIAKALSVSIEERIIDEKDLAREIVQYMWYFEHPIAGGTYDLFGGVAFHALARLVSTKVKVAFCGEGADELFLGYHRIHVDPSLTVKELQQRAFKYATPVIKEWIANNITIRTLRKLVLHEGLSEYHLASVDRSGMAFGLEIRPPYLDEKLVSLIGNIDECNLIDYNNKWTKIPLRQIATRRFVEPGTERIAIRRKRAMSSAVETIGLRLIKKIMLSHVKYADSIEPLLRNLFFYLHVDPGLMAPPNFSLFEFANESHSSKDLL